MRISDWSSDVCSSDLPGFHVIEVESPRLGHALLGKDKPMYVRATALVTNLGVHIKWGRDDLLAWVTTLDQGKVVPNARITVLSCAGKVLYTGKTNTQGIWHVRDRKSTRLNSSD